MAKKKKKIVKFGVIGCGSMGKSHCRDINDLPDCELVAVADQFDAALEEMTEKYEGVQTFKEGKDLINKADVDAILIATPHYDHPPLAKLAFKKGIHVLCEKPVAVTAYDADSMNKAYAKVKSKGILFGAMFQQRTVPAHKKIKELIDEGQLGELQRFNWIITDWFRTQTYYDSGGWRATWSGEGGGALINQCPHQLDLIQWFVGCPVEVIATVGIGKYHHIEVEDEVNAMLKFKNGATGIFITSTGETPGTNRLEIIGDRGKLVYEGGSNVIHFTRTDVSVKAYTKNSPDRFGRVPSSKYTIEVAATGGAHKEITRNFVAAINGEEKLIAEAVDGIMGLELGNAMLMSGLSKSAAVKIPTPRRKFLDILKKLIAGSKFKKNAVKAGKDDFSKSF